MAVRRLLVLFVFFPTPCLVWADPIINEFVVRPAGGEGEWIEMWNPDSQPASLDGWAVRDATGNARVLSVPDGLDGGAFLILAARPESLRAHYRLPDTVVIVRPNGWPILNDGDGSGGSPADVIVIARSDGSVVDSVAYFEAWLAPEPGRSLERGSAVLPGSDPGAWGWSVDPSGATPGSSNSLRVASGSMESVWEGPAAVEPARSPAVFTYHLPGPGTLAIWLLDRDGNQVTTLQEPRPVSGTGQWVWSAGQVLPPRTGLYFLCMRWQSTSTLPVRRCRSVWVSL